MLSRSRSEHDPLILILGMVSVNPETKYYKVFEEFMKKKHRTAVDSWGADETHVKPVFDQLEQFVKDNVSEKLFPSS